ncbi:MAG: YihY/virulence factor BrkB family protein [Lachnospiraceae bacterium]|nr:YihY/virulence factor BrkB family protein [Lachnospiraceae bacterium]
MIILSALFTIVNLIRAAASKIKNDYVNAFSAQAAFYVIICLFPFAMFLLTLLQYIMNYLPITQEEIVEMCVQVFPKTLEPFLQSLIEELYGNASGTLLSVTVITTLWSASRGFLAISRGLEKVYNTPVKRSYLIRRTFSAIYTLIFAVSLVLLLVIFVFGNTIAAWVVTRLPFLTRFTMIIMNLRTLVGLAFLTLFFLAIYLFIPNRRSKFFRELPGALLAAAGWMGFSFLYSFYIDNMSNFSATYGSLTAVVLCMLWLYACMYILFVGAELNALLASPAFRSSLRFLFKRLRPHHKKEAHEDRIDSQS